MRRRARTIARVSQFPHEPTVAPAPVAPPVAPASTAPSAGNGRFWAGFGVGCAVSLVLAAACVVVLAVVGFLAAANQALTGAPAASGVAHADASPAPGSGDGGAIADAQAAILDALEQEEYDRAESIARALCGEHPDDPDCRAMLQEVRIARAVAAEDVAAADALLREAREAAMEIDAMTELGVGELWLDEGEADRARAIAEHVLSTLAGNPSGEEDYDRYARGAALVIRGLARADLGDPDGAIADLEEALRLAPDEEARKAWTEALDELREKSR